MINIKTQSALIAAIICFFLAVSFIIKTRGMKRKVYYAFIYLNINIFIWELAFFLYAVTGEKLFNKIFYLAYSFLPPAVLYFTLHLLMEKDKGVWKIFKSTLGATFILIILLFSPLFQDRFWGIVYLLYLISVLSFSFYKIYLKYNYTSSAAERTRLNYLLIGGGFMLFFGSTNLLPYLGISFPPSGNIVLALYIYFVSLLIINYRLLDLYEMMGKILVSGALILIISTIYGSMILWTGNQTALLIFNTFIASLLVLILFEPIKSLVEKMTNNFFFKQQSDFKRDLNFLKVRLADVISQDQLIKSVLESLKTSHRISGGSIYLLDRETDDYILKDKFCKDKKKSQLTHIRDKSFIDHIQYRNTPLLLDELEREMWEDSLTTKVSELKQLSKILLDMNCQVSIPLISQSRIIGLLNLKSEKSLESFSRDEIDLLIQLADQIALSLTKVEVYEKMKDKDRLIALGEMAAGLAHEIRNPLGSIKGASQYLIPDINQSDAQDLLKVINDEVDRLNRVVSKFLDYAGPFRLNLQNSDINEILAKSSDLVSQKNMPANIKIEMNLGNNLPEVEIDRDQIQQVCLNLILNGIQAMPTGGTLTISTCLVQNDKNLTMANDKIDPAVRVAENQFIQLKFEDIGEGIPPKDLKNIFTPFFTSKEGGVGLGLAISNRIIEAHGGSIKVISQIGKGSQFLVIIPLKKKGN